MVEFLTTLLGILGLLLSGRETAGGKEGESEGGTEGETEGRCPVPVPRKTLLFKELNMVFLLHSWRNYL